MGRIITSDVFLSISIRKENHKNYQKKGIGMSKSKITMVKVAILLIGSVVLGSFLLFYRKQPDHTISLIDEKEESISQMKPEEQGNLQQDNAQNEKISEDGVIKVHVCGAVSNPGVYEVSENARVCDAVKAAGGFLKGAATDYINQAHKVVDAEQIYIPTTKEIDVLATSGDRSVQVPGKDDVQGKRVNINTATKEELMTLPGLGEAKADLIIKFRETNGPFTSIEDIKKISGIKDGVFTKISDLITTD